MERSDVSTEVIPKEKIKNLRNVVFHYTDILSAMGILKNGLISRSYAYRHNLPYSSENQLSVQDKNDHPEWISVWDADSPNLDRNQIFVARKAIFVIPKSGLEITDQGAQHRLGGEVWLNDHLSRDKLGSVVVPREILEMKVGDFFQSQVGDYEWKNAYKWYQVAANKGDSELRQRILAIGKQSSEEVNLEVPDGYWQLVGEEAERRQRRRLVESELYLETGITKNGSVGDMLRKFATASGTSVIGLVS